MELKFICPTWGMESLTLEEKLKKIKHAGYDGVEMGAPINNLERDQSIVLMEKYNLLFVAQQWTEGETVAEHCSSFEQQLKRNLELNPILINSHTGRDYFTFENNIKLLKYTEEISKDYDIKITHETLRGRLTFSAMATNAYLEKIPQLELTADFSHWCCVSESYLEEQNEFVENAIKRAVHIHARVGYPQGPQVTDPRAPEWQGALEKHLNWWDKIIESNRNKGFDLQTIAPEFGPIEYMSTIPFTNLPVADQWDINCYMKDLLRKRFQ